MIFRAEIVVWISLAMLSGWFLCRTALAKEFNQQTSARTLFLILLIPAVAFMSPAVGLVHFAAAALIVLWSRTKAEAVSVFILCLFLFPELAVRFQIGSVYIVDLTSAMAATLGLLACRFVKPGPTTKLNIPILLSVLLFAGLLIVTVLRVGGVPIRPFIDIAIRVLAPTILIATMLTKKSDVRLALSAILVSGVCLSALAVLETARSWPIYQEVYRIHGLQLAFSSSMQIRGGVMRAPTNFAESTSFAILLSMSLFIAAWLAGLTRSGLHRLALSALIILALLAAVSRGAFIAVAIGFAISSLYAGRAKRAAGLVVAGIAGFAALRVIAPYSQFISGMFNTTSRSGAADYRVDLFNAGIEIVKNYPLTGLSIPELTARLSFLSAGGIVDFVNSYLYFAMTGGVAGGLIFLGLTTMPQFVMWQKRSALSADLRTESAILVAMSSATIFLFFFTSYFERNPYWLSLCGALVSSLTMLRATAPNPNMAPRGVADRGTLPRLLTR